MPEPRSIQQNEQGVDTEASLKVEARSKERLEVALLVNMISLLGIGLLRMGLVRLNYISQDESIIKLSYDLVRYIDIYERKFIITISSVGLFLNRLLTRREFKKL